METNSVVPCIPCVPRLDQTGESVAHDRWQMREPVVRGVGLVTPEAEATSRRTLLFRVFRVFRG